MSARVEFGYYLPYWPRKRDYRDSYVARKALGGGIILDSSHEIDSLRWLIGEVKEVSCFAGKISNLDIETEDTAEILLKFKNGAIAEAHLDITRHDFSRIYELIGEKGTIIWDQVRKFLRIYSAKTKRWQPLILMACGGAKRGKSHACQILLSVEPTSNRFGVFTQYLGRLHA